MLLSRLRKGERGCVLALRGGREFQQRIVSLGLRVGCEIEVLQKGSADDGDGPVVVRSGDTRLMVGHGMAEKIVVRTQ
jgi:Fe2+ transport system protein FeoA